MTPPSSPARDSTRWYFRPRVILPLIVAFIVVAAVFTPEWGTRRSGDDRLTTHSAQRMGARIFFELARRLGWQTERRVTRDFTADPRVIHAVLGAETVVRRADVGRMLDHVRAGGALLVVASDGAAAFGDSLHLAPGGSGYAAGADSAFGACPRRRAIGTGLWSGRRPFLVTLRWRSGPPDSMATFVEATAEPPDSAPERVMTPRPALAGYALGRGRVVVARDEDIFRNDAMRVCAYGLEIAVVRALEYLRGGGDAPRDRVVFDEFHHGFGAQPGGMKTIGKYLGGTPSGRGFAQLCVAGLLLLAAVAPRAIAPRHVVRVERRSPFEHVDALARAYAQVGASRTAASRLVRGVRRRVEPGVVRAPKEQSDDAFLERVLVSKPALAADVGIVQHALQARLSPREFARFGEALERIESSLIRI